MQNSKTTHSREVFVAYVFHSWVNVLIRNRSLRPVLWAQLGQVKLTFAYPKC